MIPTAWDASQDEVEWVILDRLARVLRRGKNLLNSLPQCDETEIIVPASMVSFIPAQLPPGSHSKVLSALPFLVEAGLISTPEETHAVLATRLDNQIVVAVIQKAWVKRLLERLARADIFPNRMFPETLLPELPSGAWAMVCRGGESFIRTSPEQGFPLDVDCRSAELPLLLAIAVKQATEESKRPTSISLYGETPEHTSLWAKQLDVPITRATKQEWFVSDSQASLNLLQGEFQTSGGALRRLAAFKPVAITLLCLLVMQLMFSIFDYAIKANTNRKLDKDMVAQFKASFPNANTVVDAPLQMQRNLDELKHGAGQSGNADFMPLLSAVTTSIGAISAEKLKGMAYLNNKLTLNLLVPDINQAQAMQQRLLASGLSAEIEGTRQLTQGLELQLVIRAGAL